MKTIELGGDVDLHELAAKSNGYSGADVANVCRDASMMSVRRLMEQARKQGLGKEQVQAMFKCVLREDLSFPHLPHFLLLVVV